MTGFPPLFDGRVKTLHPKVFGAILYDRDNPEHQAQAEKYAIAPITTVAANLYPFEATVAKGGTTHAEAIEQIDIGGVSLLRAAAKNFDHVAVLTHPSQYAKFIAALEAGTVPTQMRRELAIAAFERTAEYDAAIAHYLATEGSVLPSDLPGALTVTLPLAQRLRYGTNPQNRAAFYLDRPDRLPEQLHGKALSYNNLLDLDATLRLLSRAPLGRDLRQRARALRARRRGQAYGAVRRRAAFERGQSGARRARSRRGLGLRRHRRNRCDDRSSKRRSRLRSSFSRSSPHRTSIRPRSSCCKKKKNLRIMRFVPSLPDELARELRVRSALGGVLAEDDNPAAPPEEWHVVSKRQPSAARMARPGARLGRRAPRQVERDRDRQRRNDARHLRRSNQSRQRGGDRGASRG